MLIDLIWTRLCCRDLWTGTHKLPLIANTLPSIVTSISSNIIVDMYSGIGFGVSNSVSFCWKSTDHQCGSTLRNRRTIRYLGQEDHVNGCHCNNLMWQAMTSIALPYVLYSHTALCSGLRLTQCNVLQYRCGNCADNGVLDTTLIIQRPRLSSP